MKELQEFKNAVKTAIMSGNVRYEMEKTVYNFLDVKCHIGELDFCLAVWPEGRVDTLDNGNNSLVGFLDKESQKLFSQRVWDEYNSELIATNEKEIARLQKEIENLKKN